MAWNATARYDTDAAPGGLGLVHDFLSTAPVGHPAHDDLLDTLESAQTWLDTALETWASESDADLGDGVVIKEEDLPALKQLRTSLLAAIGSREKSAVADDVSSFLRAQLSISLSSDGRVELRGDGTPRTRVLGTVLKEVYEAQLRDTWRRLKACRNPHCRIVFFDRSKNNSRVWDDVGTCGNREHLRTFRARQQANRADGSASQVD
jgi:predicted RNA-binding Zn ribbon-like protein